jgi:hypothetical protein
MIRLLIAGFHAVAIVLAIFLGLACLFLLVLSFAH